MKRIYLTRRISNWAFAWLGLHSLIGALALVVLMARAHDWFSAYFLAYWALGSAWYIWFCLYAAPDACDRRIAEATKA